MRPVRELASKFQSSDGRIKLTIVLGVSALVTLLSVLLVLPALAGAGSDSGTHHVFPAEVSYGGGPGACFATLSGTVDGVTAERLPSAAAYQLHINNPMPGTTTYEGPDPAKTKITVTVGPLDQYFGFLVDPASPMAVFDVVVNGGSKNTHFDYDDHVGPGGEPFPGPQQSDTELHAPTKGGSSNLYNLSHINICYDVNPPKTLSGIVFEDTNANSSHDVGEPGEALTVTAYDSTGTVAATTTSSASNGSYSLSLVAGNYTVCLQQRTTHQQTIPDAPPEGSGVNCTALGTHEPVGYSVSLTSNQSGIDFGNLPNATCGATTSLSGEGLFTSASVTIFGNEILDCGEKGLSFFIDNEQDPPTVGVLLDGAGTAAGRVDITKTFLDSSDPDPNGFVALSYAEINDPSSAVQLQWCNVRSSTVNDRIVPTDPETHFSDVLGDSDYPSLLDDLGNPIKDTNGKNAIACKVYEGEDINGTQYTVVYLEALDPHFY